MMSKSTQSLSFALIFNCCLLALVIAGFSSRAVLHPEYWPPVRASLVLHIIATAGWFILVVYQAVLVRRQEIIQHKHLGQFGAALAVLVLVTGIMMIVELNQRTFSWIQIGSNALNLATFAIFFSAALLWRHDRRVHMRMMTFASLSLMTPAIARLLQSLGAEGLTHPVWLALCGTVLIYDLRQESRVTRATWFGVSVSLAGFAAFVILIAATARTANAEERVEPLANPSGYVGRIRLVRYLDEPDGYCIDVPGGGDRVFLNMPAIAHTCHFDPLPDQVFDFNVQGQGKIIWKGVEPEVCLQAAHMQGGAQLRFSACDEPKVFSFEYADNGELRLSGSDLCLSVERTGPGFGEVQKDRQDQRGRGHAVNPQFTHLARALVLAVCGNGDPSMQRWKAYRD